MLFNNIRSPFGSLYHNKAKIVVIFAKKDVHLEHTNFAEK